MSASEKEVLDSLQKLLFHEYLNEDIHEIPSNLTMHESKHDLCLQPGVLCFNLLLKYLSMCTDLFASSSTASRVGRREVKLAHLNGSWKEIRFLILWNSEICTWIEWAPSNNYFSCQQMKMVNIRQILS